MTDLISCAACGAQYLASATTCADCGVPLAAGATLLEPGDDEVGYDLADLGDGDRAALAAALAGAGVSCRWEGAELVIRESDADEVEALIDDVDNPDALEADEGDDDGGADVLSALFVAADVLQNDASSTVAVLELLEASDRASELGPPYGLDGALWKEVQRRADAVAEVLGTEAGEEEVMAAARSLREAVHPLV